MRAAIIVNPAKSDVAEARTQIDTTLTAAGWTPSLWLETTPDDPGMRMAQAAVESGVQLVVICGGDGTVMACLGALSGSGLPVAILPLGSGNLLARNLGIPLELDEALATVVDGEDRCIDLGMVGDQPFAVMAGMGFDAAMMADTTEGMKQFAGWPAYVASALRHLRDPLMRVRLRIDGGPPLRRSARTVLIGNVGQLEGGLELLPDAAADDGILAFSTWLSLRRGHFAIGCEWRTESCGGHIRRTVIWNVFAGSRSRSWPTGWHLVRWTAR